MSLERVGVGNIGYARVGAVDQNADLQHPALKAAGCHQIFTDHGVSGTKASRPELEKMLDHPRYGYEVVVWKLVRLGCNTHDLLALIDELEHKGVHFRGVTEGISTTGPMGRAMLTVMAAFAQPKCDQLAERTRAGMAAAAGHTKVKLARDLKAQGLAPADIGKIAETSRDTVYRYLSIGSNQL